MEHTLTPWRECGHDHGGCICGQIWSEAADCPVATVITGKWGDDYPSIRLIGGSLDRKAEAYMEQITYGEVPEEAAKANAAFIVRAVNCHEQLVDACRMAHRVLLQLDNHEDYTIRTVNDLATALAAVEEKP